ncbi:MAG: MBL fold metallo-hydrolase [Candidatus Hodarchaeales archaeon]|jgi:phosphoribosyl 1,2-cyclic phosphate phosphodiesterase
MKLKVIGSSGAHPFPKPGCSCADCKKAQRLGIPYERISSALFVHPDILIDTPEEIFRRLIQFNILQLNHVFYTHWHPDHTQGMRLFETWVFSGFIGKKNRDPINVYVPVDMIADFDQFLPSFRGHFEPAKFINIVSVEDRKPVPLGSVTVTPLNLRRQDRVRYAFLIEERGKKVIYAPCSIFETQFDEFWNDIDLLFIETGWPGDTAKLRKEKTAASLEDHISLEENFDFIAQVKPRKTILTHLEGGYHVTYDQIKKIAEEHPAVDVAHDGLEIEL